jgi:excisionase family DNA binding protein
MPRPISPLAPLDPLQRYSVDEATRYLRVSRPTLYEQIHSGQIATIKDGKRRYIPGSELVRKSSLPERAA